jgi:hypothetical protein
MKAAEAYYSARWQLPAVLGFEAPEVESYLDAVEWTEPEQSDGEIKDLWRHLVLIIDKERPQAMIGGIAPKRKRVEGSQAQLVDECEGLINFENQIPLTRPTMGEIEFELRSGIVEFQNRRLDARLSQPSQY